MKPKAYNNSWLGIMGVTSAFLVDVNGRTIGKCMDTPNNIAHAMQMDDRVIKAKGMFGDSTREQLVSRIGTEPSEYHERYIKFY